MPTNEGATRNPWLSSARGGYRAYGSPASAVLSSADVPRAATHSNPSARLGLTTAKRWVGIVCAFGLCSLPACTRSEPDQLIWLSPTVPCEAGDPHFGTEHCYVRRKSDAVAVLRVPAHYGQADNGSRSGGFSAEDVVFTPTEVLTSGKSGEAWLAEMNAMRKRDRVATVGESHFMQSLIWGWRTQTYPEGHATAMRRMQSDATSPHFGDGAAYVPIESAAPDFKAYTRKACVNYMARISSVRGQLTPPHPCSASWVYFLPKEDDRVFATCAAPFVYDDKITYRAYCGMEGYFKWADVGGRPFIIVFTYLIPWREMASGHWKHVNRRFEAWIRSMDVSATELERIKK